jgi:hypothetical protein
MKKEIYCVMDKLFLNVSLKILHAIIAGKLFGKNVIAMREGETIMQAHIGMH